MLIWLENHKLIRSTFSYLQESVACHLHDTWKVFFHKLEKFLTNGQKLQIGCMNALTSKLKISKNEKNKIDDIALQAVVQDSCAFNVFSKPGMRAFIQYLKPGYQPPNRKTIARRLKKK